VTDADRLLREEAAAWRELEATFAVVPADRFEEPTLTPEGWSPKDAMFHVAGWMRDCAVQLEAMRSGAFDAREETREAIERQNQVWFEESRDLPAEAVRRGFEDARRQMLDSFGAMTTVTPDAVEWFEESGALHYPKHVEDLRTFLEREP